MGRIINRLVAWIKRSQGSGYLLPVGGAMLLAMVLVILYEVLTGYLPKEAMRVWSRAIPVAATGLAAGLVALVVLRISRQLTAETLQEAERRRHAMGELEFERELNQALIEGTPDPIYFKDRQGRFIRVNEAMARAFGVGAPRDVVGKTEADFLPEDEASAAAEEDRRVLESGEPTTGHEEVRHLVQGEESWVSVTRAPLRNVRNEVIGTFGVSRDISEIRRTNARLRELSQAVEQSPSVVLITDIQGDITYVNAKFTSLTGYGAEEVLGKNPRLLKGEDASPGIYKDMWETIAAGRAWTGEILNRKKNGEKYWGLASISPIRDGEGRITHYLEVMEDITSRKRAEEALRDRLEFQRQLMDAIPIPLFQKNRAGAYQDCNRAFEAFIGKARERVLGHTVFDLAPYPLASEYQRRDEELFRSGGNQVYEASVLHADGTLHHVLFNKAALTDAHGEVIGLVGTIFDLTELNQARAELREQHQKREELETIISNSPAMVFLWRAEPGWPVEYVSDSVRQLGYSPDDFLEAGLPYSQIIHPEDLTRVTHEVGRYTQAGINKFTQEYRVFSRRGDVRWLDDRTWLRRDASGRVTHYQGILMDVTESRLARDREQAMLRGLRAIFGMTDPLLACESSEEIFRRAVELSREQLKLERAAVMIKVGEEVHATFGTNLKGQTTDEFEHVFPMDDRWRQRFRIPEANEKPWFVEQQAYREWDGRDMVGFGEGWVAITPIYSQKEGAIGVFCNDAAISGSPIDEVKQELLAVFCTILGNIIARKRAEEEQRRVEEKQRDVLERTDRLTSLGVLAAGMAHEINNPLQGMLSHLHLVRKHLENEESVQTSLEMVSKGIETIAALVRKLLILGKTKDDAGETVDCREALEFVIQLLSNQFRKSRVTLVTSLPVEPLSLGISRRYLIQVLLNLLINAKDAMPKGGTVRVKAWREESRAHLSIADEGVGIPADRLPNIFQPFFTTKDTKGTGLGLSVADSLVRSAGGTIDVDSRPGKGTTFTLHLPLAGS
ncbi:MAG TPA: PAS domain S-box protein [Kiritimatiellia bacterium]|nr:PAS domain S-box protein [Kiritimatiellia bacterium]